MSITHLNFFKFSPQRRRWSDGVAPSGRRVQKAALLVVLISGLHLAAGERPRRSRDSRVSTQFNPWRFRFYGFFK